MRAFAGVLVVIGALVLALPAQAQTLSSVSIDQALADQLTTNGVADPANATGEELAAAISALAANNPNLGQTAIQDLVRAAVRRNPAAFQTIALAGANAANSLGGSSADIESVLSLAIGVAASNGQNTTGAAATLASQASASTGKPVSTTVVASNAGLYETEENYIDLGILIDRLQDVIVVLEENPNQDASPS